jgi:hypothetical protein
MRRLTDLDREEVAGAVRLFRSEGRDPNAKAPAAFLPTYTKAEIAKILDELREAGKL